MKGRNLIVVLFAALAVASCSPRSQYDRRLARELRSGIRQDSLLLGLYLGMPEKEFYVHCWNLNKKGLIKQGATNTTVEYQLKNQLNFPAVMDFYPKFNNGKISELPIKIKYLGWTPWNKKMSTDKLQKDILHWYEKIYGRGFIRVVHPVRGAAYVKLDGNRRITIFRENELYVWVLFTDMLVKQGWNNFGIDSTTVKK
jgi:hypothetical protein